MAIICPPKSRATRFVVAGSLVTVVAAIFGGYSVVTHAVLNPNTTLSALVYALLRDAIGSILLLSAAYITERRKGAQGKWIIEWEHAGYFLILGLTGVYGAQGMSAMVRFLDLAVV